MKRILKSKYTKFIFITCLIGSAILIVINYSQINNYQIKVRNDERKKEVGEIAATIKGYIQQKNTCPKILFPSAQFLPELIVDSSNNPKGGVSTDNLAEIKVQQKDPSGSPYFIGAYNDLIYIYTNDYEVNSTTKQVYFETIEANLCNQVVQ